ncbi:hypothetical protein [Blastopirellula retiformator]|uniref:hypothetical protein n=1 Tax=Blastopirellula retiformator TaxID=2527970 RepID=UPI0036F206D1
MLTSLDVSSTNVTKEGAKSLEKRWPRLKVKLDKQEAAVKRRKKDARGDGVFLACAATAPIALPRLRPIGRFHRHLPGGERYRRSAAAHLRLPTL